MEAQASDIVVAPAGTAHRFINSGSDRLRLNRYPSHTPQLVTE